MMCKYINISYNINGKGRMKMKKKIISLLTICLFIMGISTTAMAMNCPFMDENGASLENYLTKLWVGETIRADLDNYEYEVLEGAENIEIGAPYETYGKGIKLLNTGTAKIKVTSKENTEDSEIYDFIILPAEEPYVEYLVPNKIKIGYITEYMYTYHNCLLNSYSHGYDMSELTWNDWQSYFLMGINWGGAYATYPETRTVEGFLPGCATRPGTIHIAAKRDESTPYIVTIEEPVINTNLPQRVQVGTELQMTTSLDNTVLENKKIADVKYSYPDQRLPLAYQPKVEIVSGVELVERSNGDYSNILNSSENIKFTGEGTVVFKVVYEMVPIEKVSEPGSPVAIQDEAMYSPEKTFTVEVTTEGINSGEIVDQTNENVQVNTTGLDWDSICKNNQLDLSRNNVEVMISQDKSTQENSAKLEQRAQKEGFSVKAVYEILMSLYADGNKIADITDDFGNVYLNLYVGKDYAGKKAVVYQLHNGEEIITHSDLNVKEDGTVAITVNKLSAFAVAIENDSTAQTPVSGNKVNETTPKSNSHIESVATGDNANIVFWSVLCIIGGIVAIFLVRKNYIKRTR